MGKTILINSAYLGSGDDELGAKLMGSFLRKLSVAESRLERIIFYNSGVQLVAEGSPVLDALVTLAEQGTELIACGTCLAHFGLLDKIKVGRKTDMQEIVRLLTGPDAVVTV
ncbi:MAG: response regulator SirA [Candidatus Riflebacteria bacterium RBG_13_59_9]|nr:MAG: response regulator SirA [Candidatus Riflebacteria bacterium RBG_13_59_9]